jgi:hypothetical protein
VAKINVDAIVTAPQQITVPLIRADHAETSNIFRLCFEVFLAIFASLLGYVLALPTPTKIHWVFLAVIGLSTVAFGILSFRYSRKARL